MHNRREKVNFLQCHITYLKVAGIEIKMKIMKETLRVFFSV